MYTLDTQAAKEADLGSQYLRETGKYKGVFIRAEKLVSAAKGTHGIGFTFGTGTATSPGQTTRFDLWTKKGTGEELMGYKALMAMMTCLQLRSITPKPGHVDRYDYDTQSTHLVESEIFPDLIDKPIGILLRNTEYEKMRDGVKTGETGWRLELAGAFQASTELTASEILDKKTAPMQLANMVAALADRPLKKAATGKAVSPQAGGQHVVDPDDDIPF